MINNALGTQRSMSDFLQWLSCVGVRYGLQCSKCTHLVEAWRGRSPSGGACFGIQFDSIA